MDDGFTSVLLVALVAGIFLNRVEKYARRILKMHPSETTKYRLAAKAIYFIPVVQIVIGVSFIFLMVYGAIDH